VTTTRTAELTRIGEGYRALTGTGVEARFGAASDDALSPMDTLLAALGACTAMDVHGIATKKRQRIDGYRIRVRGEQRDEHPRIYTRIDVTHEVLGSNLDVDAIRRSIELSAGRYCPVSAMLSSGETEIHHHYRVRAAADAPAAWAGEVIVTGPFARGLGAPVPRPG
jgi:putative redox protein